jgi:hypothetical protein
VRKLKPCGTYAAYARHLNNNEKPCDACREANTELRRGRREDPYAAEMNKALAKNPPVIVWVPNRRGVLVAASIWDPHTKNPRKAAV